MSQEIWKEFEQNAITHSAAHHLMAVDRLMREHGYARVSDVARLLDITRGSVSISLKPLKAEGLVDQDENKFIRLSPRGQRVVDILLARRKLLIRFFSAVLRVGEEQAEVDGCKIEHLVSAATSTRLAAFLRYLEGEAGLMAKIEAGLDALGECEGAVDDCPLCEDTCLAQLVASGIGKARTDEVSGEA